MADFIPGRPCFDLENTILNIRAEVTALELAFEAIIPESDAVGILEVDRVLGDQIGLIQNDGRRALVGILCHLRDEIEDLTTGTIGRIARGGPPTPSSCSGASPPSSSCSRGRPCSRSGSATAPGGRTGSWMPGGSTRPTG